MSQAEPAEHPDEVAGHDAGRRHRRSRPHAGPSIVALILFLLAGAAIGCGESDEEKAQNQVCDARADLQKQVNELSNLTPSTATVDGVQQNLSAIEDDVKKINDAQGNLTEERRQEVESANKEFESDLESIAEGLTSDLSLGGAEQKLRTAAQQLAGSYKQTFAKVDCG
jgi:chromosome segregation ATPase